MINLTLPFKINNNEFYNNLIRLMKNKEIFFSELNFDGLYGNYPWSYWGGEKNNNLTSSLLLKDKISDINNNILFPLFLDFSNINLDAEDLYDRKMNMILEEHHNGSNKIIFSNFEVMNYIKEKYPNYSFIFSDKSNLIKIPDLKIINTILDQDCIEYIILNLELLKNNINLEKIKNKNKIKIRIGNLCNNCSNYQNCQINEHNFIYNFSLNSIYNNCNLIDNKIFQILNIQEEIKYFKKKGFNSFILDDYSNNKISNNEYNKLILLALKNSSNNKLIEEGLKL